MKRYLFIIIIVLVLIVVALAAYFFLSRRGETTASPENNTAAPGESPDGLPVAPETGATASSADGNLVQGGEAPTSTFGAVNLGPVSRVAEVKTFDFFIEKTPRAPAGQANAVTIVQPDGGITRVDNGRAETLSSSRIVNLISSRFSFDGKKALITFGDPINPEASIFDTTSKSWRPLPPGVSGAAWSPVDYRLAYFSEKNGVRAIFTLDASKANSIPQEILKIQAQDMRLEWLVQNQILLSDAGSALSEGALWSLNLKNKTLTPLVLMNPGLDSLWNPAGGFGIVFTSGAARRGGTVSLVDGAANFLHTLSFLTLPAKCAFQTTAPSSTQTGALSKTMLYCAVPRDVENFRSATLPDSYFKKELFTEDDVIAIDLKGGTAKIVFADRNQSFDAAHLQISDQSLFFINRYDSRVYSMPLTP